jgi:hypothetical protein
VIGIEFVAEENEIKNEILNEIYLCKKLNADVSYFILYIVSIIY